ncbi:MAG TPA: HlyD family secretion protein [Xanthobacteraceae bacterium]
MYVDRETGIRPPGRAGSPETPAAKAIEARAAIHPALLRRGPAEEMPDAENPQSEAPATSPVRADQTGDPSGGPKTGRSRRKLAMLGLALGLATGAAAWFGYQWWTVGRFMVSTDDAYVRANNTTLAAKVSGYVANVFVADNAYVHAGDVIATLDDGDYRLAAESARQKVVTQRATVDRFGRQVVAQQANVAQAKAQLVSAQAGATRAGLELDRQQALATKEFASHQALEQAIANRDQAAAAVQNAQAAIDAAQATVEVLRAQQQEAERTLDELATAQAKAERDLSFATIRAPIDGVFGNRAVQVGDYVQTGQRLASLVPLDEVYIDANLKETQLARLRPGQKVAISVDALPGRTLEGTVASVAPASGSVFSLLPPDNATGNFTKIVQRLPVRIQVPLAVTGERLLRPGMSVVISVDTRDQPRDGLPVLHERAASN